MAILPSNNITSSPTTSPPAPPALSGEALSKLVSELHVCLADIAKHEERYLPRAIRAGYLLSQAKARVLHGEWGKWLKENCELNERTAQRYIHLHQHRDVIEAKNDTVSNFTQRQAEQLIKTGTTGSKPAPKKIGGSDPVILVQTAEDKFLSALQQLKRHDPDTAKTRAKGFVSRLKDANIL